MSNIINTAGGGLILPRRLGKKPCTWGPQRKRASNHYKAGTLPTPKPYNLCSKLPVKGVMRNDVKGCCAVSGLGHQIQGTSYAATGIEITPSDASIDKFYDALSPGDNGTNMGDDISKCEAEGLDGRKILMMCLINPKDDEQVYSAGSIYGGVYAGMSLPAYCMTTPIWRTIGGRLAGGHAVWVGASTEAGELTAISWGEDVVISPEFRRNYWDEAYGLIFDTDFDENGLSWNGYTADQLAGLNENFAGTVAPGAVLPPYKPVPTPAPIYTPPPAEFDATQLY